MLFLRSDELFPFAVGYYRAGGYLRSVACWDLSTKRLTIKNQYMNSGTTTYPLGEVGTLELKNSNVATMTMTEAGTCYHYTKGGVFTSQHVDAGGYWNTTWEGFQGDGAPICDVYWFIAD